MKEKLLHYFVSMSPHDRLRWIAVIGALIVLLIALLVIIRIKGNVLKLWWFQFRCNIQNRRNSNRRSRMLQQRKAEALARTATLTQQAEARLEQEEEDELAAAQKRKRDRRKQKLADLAERFENIFGFDPKKIKERHSRHRTYRIHVISYLSNRAYEIILIHRPELKKNVIGAIRGGKVEVKKMQGSIQEFENRTRHYHAAVRLVKVFDRKFGESILDWSEHPLLLEKPAPKKRHVPLMLTAVAGKGKGPGRNASRRRSGTPSKFIDIPVSVEVEK
jgi:hypothetical protein